MSALLLTGTIKHIGVVLSVTNTQWDALAGYSPSVWQRIWPHEAIPRDSEVGQPGWSRVLLSAI